MQKLFPIAVMFAFVLFFTRCRDHYDPKIKNNNDHLLVVEGYINTNGQSSFEISRTRNITSGDTAANILESNAVVQIEDNHGNTFPLFFVGDGKYLSSFNQLPSGVRYRVRITTSNNKIYLSDLVEPKASPPIDSVGWKLSDGSVQLYVNTHDASMKMGFYRWSYEESWEFHSRYYSQFEYLPDPPRVVPRTVPVYVCYNTRNSTKIFIGSSGRLSQNLIFQAPLQLIPNHDKRLSVLYRSTVTQYSLDSAGYIYWQAMQSNTENVGSIFGNQPNQTKGNIHSVSDSTEKVIGYVGAGSTTNKYLFIQNSSLPAGWNLMPDCMEYDVPPDSIRNFFEFGGLQPIEIRDKKYFSALSTCVDCTLSGTLTKPAFWP